MKFDLSEMSRKELEKLSKDVDKALERVSNKELKLAQEAAAKAAAEYGYSLSDVAAAAPKRSAAVKSAPKYKNPDDSSQTWTGKGRQPDWYKTAVANGTDPETMAI